MKKLAVAALCAAVSLCVAGAAQAQGFYVGAHIGWGHEKSDWTDVDGDWHFVGPATVGGFSDSTVAFGAQFGYDWQFSKLVLGVVGDMSIANFDNDFTGWGFNGGPSCGCVSIKEDGSYLASIRGRIGFQFDWIMPYATLGFGFTDLKHTWTETGDPNDSWPGFAQKHGTVYGGGFELTPFEDTRWSFAAEGLYYDFGSESATNINGFRMDVETNVTVFRLDANYHFNGM